MRKNLRDCDLTGVSASLKNVNIVKLELLSEKLANFLKMAATKFWMILVILLIGNLIEQFAAENIIKMDEIERLIFRSGEFTGE